jgi:SAM-dependent methyltransferase
MTRTALTHQLTDYRAVWNTKPVLRLVYGDMFERIARQCVPGATLEIGGGIGNLKEHLPELWSSDIQFGQHLDLVADGQRLPFADGALGNIVMVDVLHHLEYPVSFLREAARVLRPGGRIVMVEPAITPLSYLFYHLIHEELVDMSADPLLEGEPDPDRDPYASNQAIPTLLATKYRDQLEARIPQLKVRTVDWFAPFVYPMSGGFKRWSLLTRSAAKAGLALEKSAEKWIGRACAFRVLIRIDRQP